MPSLGIAGASYRSCDAFSSSVILDTSSLAAASAFFLSLIFSSFPAAAAAFLTSGTDPGSMPRIFSR